MKEVSFPLEDVLQLEFPGELHQSLLQLLALLGVFLLQVLDLCLGGLQLAKQLKHTYHGNGELHFKLYFFPLSYRGPK